MTGNCARGFRFQLGGRQAYLRVVAGEAFRACATEIRPPACFLRAQNLLAEIRPAAPELSEAAEGPASAPPHSVLLCRQRPRAFPRESFRSRSQPGRGSWTPRLVRHSQLR